MEEPDQPYIRGTVEQRKPTGPGARKTESPARPGTVKAVTIDKDLTQEKPF